MDNSWPTDGQVTSVVFESEGTETLWDQGFLRADDGIRTRDPNLGKVVLYQLSHVRVVRETYQSPAGPGYVGETYWRPVEPNPPWPRVVCPRSSTSSQSMAATSWITSWAMRSPTATSNASAGSWLTRTTRISSR